MTKRGQVKIPKATKELMIYLKENEFAVNSEDRKNITRILKEARGWK